MDVHIRQYESETDLDVVVNDWTSQQMNDAVADLVRLARFATQQRLTVVDIWTL